MTYPAEDPAVCGDCHTSHWVRLERRLQTLVTSIPPRSPSRHAFLTWSLVVAGVLGSAVVGLAAVADATGTASGPGTGVEPPDFQLPVVFGPEPSFQLARHRGTPDVIEVFSTWCDYCRRSTPVIADAALAPRQTEVRFLGVNVDDSPAEAALAVNKWGIPYPVAWDDGRVAWNWRISALPTVIIVDADGRVSHVGVGRPAEEDLERWLADVGAARLD